MKEYEGNYTTVKDGDTQTINPENLVSEDHIKIIDAHLDFKGNTKHIYNQDFDTTHVSKNHSNEGEQLLLSLDVPSKTQSTEVVECRAKGRVSTSSLDNADSISFQMYVDKDGDGLFEFNNEITGSGSSISKEIAFTDQGFGETIQIAIGSPTVTGAGFGFAIVDLEYTVDNSTTENYDSKNISSSGDISINSISQLDNEQIEQRFVELTPGSQNITYSIDGSNKVDVKLTFHYEKSVGNALGMVGFYDPDSNVWRECRVFPPTSDLLDYNHISVYAEDEGSWGALDVVNTSHSNAIRKYQFYDSTHGWLAPREYSNTPA